MKNEEWVKVLSNPDRYVNKEGRLHNGKRILDLTNMGLDTRNWEEYLE